jgi:hypothetical protein
MATLEVMATLYGHTSRNAEYMHKYAIRKIAQTQWRKYAQMCTNKYAQNMQQQICKYVQGQRKVVCCENMQEKCKKYACMRMICNHQFKTSYMQYIQKYASHNLLKGAWSSKSESLVTFIIESSP